MVIGTIIKYKSGPDMVANKFMSFSVAILAKGNEVAKLVIIGIKILVVHMKMVLTAAVFANSVSGRNKPS